tara:strand:- start:8430 stop:8684 length:255 start_codon:yes stop_codon:yes gene_type:complete
MPKKTKTTRVYSKYDKSSIGKHRRAMQNAARRMVNADRANRGLAKLPTHMHVDHKVALANGGGCGMKNLQVLTATQNMKKGTNL